MVEELKRKDSGVPMWYVTFADLSTLMLTFFVLLISFANTDIVKFREMLGSVQGAFGVPEERIGKAVPYLTGAEVFKDSEKDDKSILSDEEKVEMEKTSQDLESMINESKMRNNLSLQSRNNEIKLRVDGGALFQSGTIKIMPEGIRLLKGLAQLLSQSDFMLTIEGHTDNQPIHTEMFPTNWELSGVRATTVLRFFITQGIDPDRLRAIGYSDTHPITDNETAESRARNRRVEFVLKKVTEAERKGVRRD